MPCLLPPQLTQARAPTSGHWVPSAAATVATELSGSKSPPFYFL